ncbi:hypothetical protein ACFQUU_05220 [Herbaspirillum sp. GCM10030257]|uniref:hypothetical protein n=1 Tax=Herbaspirillum sp. GCM10030257 TaxID=3273393 RepID=UPI00360B4512
MSSFKRHGRELLIPIPRFASVATTMVSGDWIMGEVIVGVLICFCWFYCWFCWFWMITSVFVASAGAMFPSGSSAANGQAGKLATKAELSMKYRLESPLLNSVEVAGSDRLAPWFQTAQFIGI